MNNRLIVYMIIVILLFSILVPINLHADENNYWDQLFSFRKELEIPINTSDPYTKYQPIDIPIKFKNLCWAKDEDDHSIRVIFQDEGEYIELESQIYELNKIDSEHIDTCNLVFLIPNEANGNEKYYLYYDDEQKPSPNYTDRVTVEESKYAYEPIQGLGFESSYYLIKENDEIIYGVNWKGKFLNDPTSQQIAKFKKGATEIKPNNGDHSVNFCFKYWRLNDDIWNLISTHEHFLKRNLSVDGNLMVKFGIISKSNNNQLKSTVIYKYYYCPTEDKRIFTNVKHEVTGYPLKTGKEIDTAYVTIYNGRIKSSSIEELNFGEIPPYLHYYSEDESIREYKMDQNPDSKDWEEYISKEDDKDLGSSAWVSVDYGKTDKAHAIILSSNKILKSGADERDGIELQLYESNAIDYPGLDGWFAYLYLMRNDYEKGLPLDVILPEDFVVEFDALYFTTEKGGYPRVDKEASIYQKLISFQPEDDIEFKEDVEEEEYNLTVFTHLSPDLIRLIAQSYIFLKQPRICIELVKDDATIALKKANRIPLTEDIKIDWRNITLFRKAKFSNTESEKYVVKVWLENILFKKDKLLIGYKIVDLKQDTKMRIFCKPEGKIYLTALNQERKGIEDVEISLIDDGETIAKVKTSSNGKAIIGAPCGFFNSYLMNITYKGFLISSEKIRLGRIREILPKFKKLNFNVHDLVININDSSEKPPSFNVGLSLTSSDMDNPISLKPDDIKDGTFKFNSLYSADYTLKINYESFEIEELIQIPDIDNLDINLLDFSAILKDKWDLPPNAPLDISLTSTNFKRNPLLYPEEVKPGEYLFSNLYPGNYIFNVHYKDYTIEKLIEILGNEDKIVTMEFSALFNLTTIALDTRGNPINGADVKLIRNGQEIKKITNDNGRVTFSIPPGNYFVDMYLDGESIASRKVNVLSEKSYSIVTNSDPNLPLIIIITIIICLIFVGIYSYKKSDNVFFLKIIAVSLAIIALISPWWGLSGSNSNSFFETSTELFIMPTDMITLTSYENVTAGDVLSLEEEFKSVIDYLPILIVIGIFVLIVSIIFDRFKGQIATFVLNFATAAILFATAIIFIFAIADFTSVGVGSVIGSGNIYIGIPGENMIKSISCSWNFNLGFYLILISAIILGILFLLNLRKMLINKDRGKKS